jgi:hypothetical protein
MIGRMAQPRFRVSFRRICREPAGRSETELSYFSRTDLSTVKR